MRGNAALMLLLVFGLVACGRPISEPVSDERSLDEARLMDAIEDHITHGEYDTAARRLDAALAEGFDHPRALYLRARLALVYQSNKAADVDEAIAWLERCIEQSPRWVEPRLLLAQTLAREQRLVAAAAAYAQLDGMFPEHPGGSFGRGYMAMLRGDNEEAAGFLSEALRRDPDFAPALYASSQLAGFAGDEQTQLRMLERYAAVVPTDAGAARRLGGLYTAAGRLEDARRALERAYRIQPEQETAQELADIAVQRGAMDEAARWRREAGLDQGTAGP